MASKLTKEYRQNLMVGLFMIVALASLAILVILFGDMPEWLVGGRGYQVHVYFDQLRGLTVDTEVEMNSVRVGRVVAIEHRDSKNPALGVDVTLEILNRYDIPHGAIARVHEAPMGFGRPKVVIGVRYAEPARLLDRDGKAVLQGELVSAFDQLIPRDVVTTLRRSARQIGDLAEALTPVADDLHELFAKRSIEQVDQDRTGRTPPNLYTAVEQLNRSLQHFNDVLGDPQTKSNLREAIANLRQVTEDAGAAVQALQSFAVKAGDAAGDVRQITTRLSSTVTRTDEQLDTVGRKVIENTDKLSRILDHLEVASDSLSSGKGTAGLLVSDPRLYESLVLTADRLGATIQDLQNLIRHWREKGMYIQGVGIR